MIKDLIQNNDQDGLKKAISQHPLHNAWYPLNFGAHSNEGVHGACPLEMLHALVLLLGIFKYVRDMFFEQILGGSSQLSTRVKSLTSLYGELLSCQHSDRGDMPRLKFSNGIQEGKLMANEYPGVLLLLAVTMNSSEGRKMLGGRTAGTLSEVLGGLDDLIMLVETLLMWELWLKSDKMALSHVKRAKHKHRYLLMYLMRKVGNRRSCS
jgi:hypothetical protein